MKTFDEFNESNPRMTDEETFKAELDYAQLNLNTYIADQERAERNLKYAQQGVREQLAKIAAIKRKYKK